MSNIQPGIEDDVSWTMKNLGIIPTCIAEPSKIFSIITIGKVYFGAVKALCRRYGLAYQLLWDRWHNGCPVPDNQCMVGIICPVDEISKVMSIIAELEKIHAALFRPDPIEVINQNDIQPW